MQKILILATLILFPLFAQAETPPIIVPVIAPRGEMNGSGGCPGHNFPREHILYFGVHPQAPQYQKKHFVECQISQVLDSGSTEQILQPWALCNPEAGVRFIAESGCATYKAKSRAVIRRWINNETFVDEYGPEANDEITYYAD